MPSDPASRLMDAYPRIFHACHRRHRRDPRTKRLLSESQARVLDHLDQFEPLHLGALAAHLGVTQGTMSLAVSRLVRRGYVKSRRDPRDARRVNLLLSPAGARLKESSSVLDRELVTGLLGTLSPAEREAALDGLDLLARAATRFAENRKRGGQGGPRYSKSTGGSEGNTPWKGDA